MLAAGVLALLVTQRTASVYAASSALRISPRAGTRLVDLRYTNPTGCVRCQTLVVRARWRAAEDARLPDEIPTTSAVVLRVPEGTSGDTLVGTLAVPPGAVLGVVALESPDGTWVDDNGGRPWVVEPAAPSIGTPDRTPGRTRSGSRGVVTTVGVLAARQALTTDLLERDWERAFALADSTARAFPDSVTAWTTLFGLERQLRRDSATIARQEAVLARLDQAARRALAAAPDPSGRTAAHLFRLAWTLRDAAITADTSALPEPMRYWLGAVARSAMTAPEARRLRLLVELQARYANPRAALAVLETRWAEDSSEYLLVSEGIRTAQRAADTSAAVRWWRRLGAMRPSTRAVVAQRLARLAPSRDEGIRALRELVADSGYGDAWRALGETRARFRQRQRAVVARANLALHEALLARATASRGASSRSVTDSAADIVAADSAIERAARVSWNTAALETLASRHLAHGDTARALGAFGLLSADPLRRSAFGDTIRARTGRWYQPAVVERWRDSGRVLLRTYLVSRLTPVRPAAPLAGLAGLRREDGTPVRFAGMTAPVLLSFWSAGCAPSLDELSTLTPILARVTALGLPTMLVSRGPRTPGQRRGPVPATSSTPATSETAWVVDPDGVLHRAVRQVMTPERFLLLPEAGVWRVALPASDLPLLAAAVAEGTVSPATLP